MKTKLGSIFPLVLLLCANISFGQSDIHSGYVHHQTTIEELNLFKLHCNELALYDNPKKIKLELAKYPELISSFEIDEVSSKLYIKFKNGLDMNYLLGILRRISVDAFYLENGVEVHYVKTANYNFKY